MGDEADAALVDCCSHEDEYVVEDLGGESVHCPGHRHVLKTIVFVAESPTLPFGGS